MTVNHPFPGPHFTAPQVGAVSIGLNGAAVQGPNIQCKFAYLSTQDTATVAWVVAGGSGSVGFGVQLSTAPTYFPVDNLNRLYLVGDDSTKVATYYVLN